MKAKCTYFGKCSGCTLQQFPYVKQLHDKTRLVRSELGGLLPQKSAVDTVIQALVPSPAEHGYRTSGKLCLHEDELGRRSIGLYERNSKKVVDIPKCTVHHPEINRLVERLFSFGKKLPAKLYQHNKKGFQPERLKFVVLRYCPDTREFGLILSHTGVNRSALQSWAAQLSLPNVSFYESELTAKDDDLVVSRQVTHFAGPKTFRFKVGEFDFQIDPNAFFQANYSLVPQFVSSIAEPHQGRILLDLYGGFGTYSFAAVKQFTKIHVIEANPHSIQSALELRDRLGIPSMEMTSATVEDFLKAFRKDKEQSEVTDIIVNPPRSGVSRQVIESLTNDFQNLERVTYVSCDLATLKRDLRELLRSGIFAIDSILPFDMFPQTDHVENVVRLKKKARPARNQAQANPTSGKIHPRTHR